MTEDFSSIAGLIAAADAADQAGILAFGLQLMATGVAQAETQRLERLIEAGA